MAKMTIIKEMVDKKLLKLGKNVVIEDAKLCLPDRKGNILPSFIDDNVIIRNGAKLFGGVHISSNVKVEENVILGHPEDGYAAVKNNDEKGIHVFLGENVTLRSGALIYGGVKIGDSSLVGHGTIIHANATIGRNAFIGHNTVIERDCKIGSFVRFSPLCHITSETVIEDRVFLGAGVITVDDEGMIWKYKDNPSDSYPPYFEYGARVGSGSTILTGVKIGRQALVGSGSVVTKNIPPFMMAFGSPAEVQNKPT